MGATAPAVRPCTGDAFGKKQRGMVKPSSRAQVSVMKKVEVNGVTVEMEVIPVAVGGGKALVRGMKRLGDAMVRDSSVCLAGVKEFAVPTQKCTKITSRKPNNMEIAAGVGILTTSSDTPPDPARDLLKKRLAAELDALRGLVKKAEHMSRAHAASKGGASTAGKTEQLLISSLRSELKTPSMKKRKISPVVERMQIPATCVVSVIKTEVTESCKSRISPNDEDEDQFVDICGGVSPIKVQETSPLRFSVEDGEITGNTPRSSSSSSESDSSSSDSDSDSDAESVDSPAPPAVPPEEKSAAPPEPLASAVAVHKAKLQQALLDMETAALPDESVHARDLQSLGIAEYGRPSVMRQLGLFLNDDATTAGKTEQPVASKRRSEPRVVEADGKPPLVKKRKISAPVEPTQKIRSLAGHGQPPPCPARKAVQSAELKNVVQDVQPPAAPKAVYMPGLIYRAKLRLALLEMERRVLPDESIHAQDLQSLGIAEYGRPSVMRQLGLFLNDPARGKQEHGGCSL
ncbi:hypothetical protein BS78_04G188600 [Paspalum vaginatum]|nr:hypothetical protein BS78_04G188600 [Paspalum vaginatum]